MEYSHLFRIVTIFVVLVAWYEISVRTSARWPSMTRLGRRLWMWYYGVLFAIAYLSLHAFRSDAPLSSGNYILLFTCAGLMVAALLRLSGDESTDPVYKFHLEGNITKWRIEKLR